MPLFSRSLGPLLLLVLAAGFGVRAQTLAPDFAPAEVARWQQQARQVSITRDTYGVPHISGPTDADAVFGLLYAQCEDDFARVELNYLDALGRLAEVEGEAALYHDLRARLFLDSAQAVGIYRKSPAWLKSLLQAFADGTNYYLHTHPAVRPRLLRRFEPWMPLLFSEGSIGGNISVVSLDKLKAFYGQGRSSSWQRPAFDAQADEPVGSNGFAIGPSRSASGHALLLINPHTSFYFRAEVQMRSEQGLNAYGAVTWGQFFVYQGFNEHCGWMHTSSGADSMDEYRETIVRQDGRLYYRYGTRLRPVQTQTVRLPYRGADGQRQYREFTGYRTHHGPIVGQLADDQWVAVRMMNAPRAALVQSYLRTKARDYAGFRRVMKLNGNASNNTVFADAQGTIAYWHGNFMPRRNPKFDWSQPVDGANPATEWRGLHGVDELVQVRDPASGYLQNCNSTPFTAAGPAGSPANPAKVAYPAYMAPDAENYRGLNAVRVLSQRKGSQQRSFTLDTLIAAANDPHLTAFDFLLPPLLSAYDAAAATGPAPATAATPAAAPPSPDLAEAIVVLRAWDHNYGVASVAQTLATCWAEKLRTLGRARTPANQPFDYLSYDDFALDRTSSAEKLAALRETLTELSRDFGTWRVAWGEVNRFQRLTGQVAETYDDQRPSLPVAFASSAWGSLAAFGAKAYPGTRRRYGSIGNSFVAVVEFGPRLLARSVMAGGQSSRPGTAHFTDQAARYAAGQFKDVRFYPEDVQAHAEKTYHPGEENLR